MEHCTTIGVDVSDRTSKICVMTKAEGGERRIVVETTCATTKAGFEEAFAKFDRGWPVAFETGTHCRWMERHIRSLGFRAIVANPAKARISSDPTSKNDRNDARGLARLALADPALLFPVRLRSESSQRMLRLHESRQLLMRMRTSAVCQIRSFAKSMGFRLPDVSPERFHELDRAGWPDDFERTVWPMVGAVKTINQKIAAYDSLIDELAEEPGFKAMVCRAMEVYGVGIVGATALVAAIDCDPGRFGHARDVGPYLGMTPRTFQSGESAQGPGRVRERGHEERREGHGPQAQGPAHRRARGQDRQEEGEARRGQGPRRDGHRPPEGSVAEVRPALRSGQGGVRALPRRAEGASGAQGPRCRRVRGARGRARLDFRRPAGDCPASRKATDVPSRKSAMSARHHECDR